MAASDARPVPRKNVAYRAYFTILNDVGDEVIGAAGLDSEISKDGGTAVDCANEAVEILAPGGGAGWGRFYLDLTNTEMNADSVVIGVKSSTLGAKATTIVLYPEEEGDYRISPITAAAIATQVRTELAVELARIDAAVTTRSAPGAAMTLTAPEREAIANEVEAEIIDETDSEKVLEAIVNKINAMTDLDALTLAAIATAVRNELAIELGRIDVAVGSRAVAGDAMTLTAGERTAVATAVKTADVSGPQPVGTLASVINNTLASVDLIKQLTEADEEIHTATTPWRRRLLLRGSSTILLEKLLRQVGGTSVTSTDHVIASAKDV